MSKVQYQNSVRSILGVFEPAAATQIANVIAPDLEQVPEDTHEDFRRLSQDVSQAHVRVYHRVATQVAKEATLSAGRLSDLVGGCAVVGNNDASCIRGFIDVFGQSVFRRPLTTQESDFYYTEMYRDGPEITAEGFSDVVAGLLMAPQFLYFLEGNGDAVDGREDLSRLSDYELATRLSYHFWREQPDEALMNAAEQGELSTEAGYRAQVDRVFHDPRTKASVDAFFEQWLRLDEIPLLDEVVGTPRYDQFAGSDAASSEFRDRVIQEVLDLVGHYVWTVDGSWKDVFLSRLSFARSEDLAGIYGVPVWDGQQTPPTFAEGARSGLVTRAAFLVTGTARTRPIHKGEFIRRTLLCDVLPDPPADVGLPPDFSKPLSTRALIEEMTEQPDSNCAGCHKEDLNPLGFATEHYDALGRTREEQTLYTDDGAFAAVFGVDSESVPRVDINDTRTALNGVDLSQYISESNKIQACLSRRYFRYVYGRTEDLAADACALEALRAKMVEGGSLRDMLESVALQPEFRMRKHPTE